MVWEEWTLEKVRNLKPGCMGKSIFVLQVPATIVSLDIFEQWFTRTGLVSDDIFMDGENKDNVIKFS